MKSKTINFMEIKQRKRRKGKTQSKTGKRSTKTVCKTQSFPPSCKCFMKIGFFFMNIVFGTLRKFPTFHQERKWVHCSSAKQLLLQLISWRVNAKNFFNIKVFLEIITLTISSGKSERRMRGKSDKWKAERSFRLHFPKEKRCLHSHWKNHMIFIVSRENRHFLLYQWRHELPRLSIRLFPLRVHCNFTQFSRTLMISRRGLMNIHIPHSSQFCSVSQFVRSKSFQSQMRK